MLNLTNAQALADNVIVINGVEIARLTDTDAQRVLDVIRGLQSNAHVSTPVSAPVKPTAKLHIEETPTKKAETIPGKPMWQEDFCTVAEVDVDGKKQYRLYITCPVGGEKGKKIRTAIKLSAKDMGAKFAGNYDAGEIFWAFPSKAKASEYVKSRKEYAKKQA